MLSPGNGVGVLHTAGLTFTATGTLTVPINGPGAGTDYSQVVATGPIDVTNATLVVPIGNGFTPAGGTPFDVLVNNSGSRDHRHVRRPVGGRDVHGRRAEFHDHLPRRAERQRRGADQGRGRRPADGRRRARSTTDSDQRSEVRSISVTFSGPVSFAGGDSNAAAAFQLQHVQTRQQRHPRGGRLEPTTRSVTLTFSGGETDPISALNGGVPSLADGRYQLTISGSAVTGAGGVALDGAGNGTAGQQLRQPGRTASAATGLHLYRLYGDVNGDGVVDSSTSASSARRSTPRPATRSTSPTWTPTTAGRWTPKTSASSAPTSTSTCSNSTVLGERRDVSPTW